MSDAKQPINIVDFRLAIKELNEIELTNIRSRLTVSVGRLQESNKLMSSLLNKLLKSEPLDDDGFEESTDTEGDIKLYEESIRENEFVIDNQNKRIESIDNELSYRGIDETDSTSVMAAKENSSKKSAVIDEDNDLIDSTTPNSIFI